MRPHTTLFATAILALSLAPAAQAHGYGHPPQSQDQPQYQPQDQYQGQDQYQPQDQYQGQDQYQRYQNLDRYSYPDAAHIDRVSELAHAIDETATYIHRQFERNNRRPNVDEVRAMEQLHALNESAAHFHAEVESYQQNPRHTVRDFVDLERTFNNTVQALRYTGRRSYVDRGMVRIYSLMNELAGYYGVRSGYGHWGGHDRYDRGRYDRDRSNDRDHGYDHDHDNGYRPPYVQ